MGFASTFAYPVLKHSFGVCWSYTPFCLCLALTIGVYVTWLPETKGKTFEKLAFSSNFRQNAKESQDKEPLLLVNGELGSNGRVMEKWDSEDEDDSSVHQNGSCLIGQNAG